MNLTISNSNDLKKTNKLNLVVFIKRKTIDRKIIYHLTSIDNLESILENGLMSRDMLLHNSFCFKDIANEDIVNKREAKNINNYVPFHFNPYSAFDTYVKHHNDNLIYICVLKDFAKINKFRIIINHPLNNDSCEYSYEEGISKIDWEAMDTNLYETTDEDFINRIKKSRMSECVGINKVMPNNIYCIFCSDNNFDRVNRIVMHYNYNIKIYKQRRLLN